MVRSGVIEVKLTPFLNSFELRLSLRRHASCAPVDSTSVQRPPSRAG